MMSNNCFVKSLLSIVFSGLHFITSIACIGRDLYIWVSRSKFSCILDTSFRVFPRLWQRWKILTRNTEGSFELIGNFPNKS